MIYHNDSLPEEGLDPTRDDSLILFTTRECPVTFLSSGECVAHHTRAAAVFGDPLIAIPGGTSLRRVDRLDLKALAKAHRPPGLDLDLALRSLLLGPFGFSRNSLITGSVYLGRIFNTPLEWKLQIYGTRTLGLTRWSATPVSARMIALEVLQDYPELMFPGEVEADMAPYTTERKNRMAD